MANEARLHGKLETPAVDTRAVLIAGCASLVLVGGAVLGLDAIYRDYVPRPAPPPPRIFPEPRVQVNESAELRRLLAEQRARLAGYAWADRDKGLVRIPIARAMQLIVQKGEHAFDPLAPASPALTGPSAGAQRAVTPGQGAPAGLTGPAAPAINGTAPADQHREAKP
jgi:hypothetical protein